MGHAAQAISSLPYRGGNDLGQDKISKLINLHFLLSCFRRDSHKIDSFLKVLRCRMANMLPEMCWRGSSRLCSAFSMRLSTTMIVAKILIFLKVEERSSSEGRCSACSICSVTEKWWCLMRNCRICTLSMLDWKKTCFFTMCMWIKIFSGKAYRFDFSSVSSVRGFNKTTNGLCLFSSVHEWHCTLERPCLWLHGSLGRHGMF